MGKNILASVLHGSSRFDESCMVHRVLFDQLSLFRLGEAWGGMKMDTLMGTMITMAQQSKSPLYTRRFA